MDTTPTSDEKVMAALAHASVILSFLGPIAPTLIWSTQRQKSNYVRYHALQAMGYQALFFWLWFIGIFGLFLLIFPLLIVFSALFVRNSNNMEFFPFLIQALMFLFIFGFFGCYYLVGLVGAVFCFLGRDFRYPLLGNWLKRYLSRDAILEDEINEIREEQWVGGLCHSTVVLQMWGIILPLIVWILQKERSAKLKFQAAQAAAHQTIAFAAYMLGMMVYMFLFFGIMVAGIGGSLLSGGGQVSGLVGMLMVIVLVGAILVMFATILTIPIFQLVGLVGVVRTIRGHDFHYPFLGRFIERRMKPASETAQ